MKKQVSTAILIAAAVILGGCGSSAKTYTLAGSEACLKAMPSARASTTEKPNLDGIAAAAAGGAIEVTFADDNFVTVGFEPTSAAARRDLQNYTAFAHGNPAKDTLERTGNVTIAWNATPTGDQRAAVKACLA